MDTSDGADIRATLRRHLKQSLVARDKPAAQVLRSALAAIENAEAQPIVETRSQTELSLEPGRHADVPRRVVTDADARALVEAEVDELLIAARHYDSLGQHPAAATADEQADVLRRILTADA